MYSTNLTPRVTSQREPRVIHCTRHTTDVVGVYEGVIDVVAVTDGVGLFEEYSDGVGVTVGLVDGAAVLVADGVELGEAHGGKYCGSGALHMIVGSGQMMLPV